MVGRGKQLPLPQLSVFPSLFLSFSTVRTGNKIPFVLAPCLQAPLGLCRCVTGSCFSRWPPSPSAVSSIAQCSGGTALCSALFAACPVTSRAFCTHIVPAGPSPTPRGGISSPLFTSSAKQASLIPGIGPQPFNYLCHLENRTCLRAPQQHLSAACVVHGRSRDQGLRTRP